MVFDIFYQNLYKVIRLYILHFTKKQHTIECMIHCNNHVHLYIHSIIVSSFIYYSVKNKLLLLNIIKQEPDINIVDFNQFHFVQ